MLHSIQGSAAPSISISVLYRVCLRIEVRDDRSKNCDL